MNTKKRGDKANATISKILTASLNRIIEQGEAGVSMTEIAQEVGVSRPTIYRYFPTREALLESVFDLIVNDYMDKLEQAVAEASSPADIVTTVANFGEARLKDGGAQIFRLDPALVIKLMANAHGRLINHAMKVFAPLFDMQEALTGRPVDRQSAATAYMLFSSALSFYGADAFEVNSGDLFSKMIRALPHFE